MKKLLLALTAALALAAPGAARAQKLSALPTTNTIAGTNAFLLFISPAQSDVTVTFTNLLTNAWSAGSTNLNNLRAGVSATTGGNNATALGTFSSASALNSTAVGGSAQATALGATALGVGAGAGGTNSTALGASANAVATSDTAAGVAANATGGRSTALGQGATSSATNAVALGYNAVASGAGDSALGTGAAADSGTSTAAGSSSTATLGGASAFGAGSFATQFGSALGSSSSAGGINSTAAGVSAGASALNSTALGASASATASHATALGAGASASVTNQFRLGTASDHVEAPGTLNVSGVITNGNLTPSRPAYSDASKVLQSAALLASAGSGASLINSSNAAAQVLKSLTNDSNGLTWTDNGTNVQATLAQTIQPAGTPTYAGLNVGVSGVTNQGPYTTAESSVPYSGNTNALINARTGNWFKVTMTTNTFVIFTNVTPGWSGYVDFVTNGTTFTLSYSKASSFILTNANITTFTNEFFWSFKTAPDGSNVIVQLNNAFQ